MSDEKVTENRKTNDELSNEDLEKVQGGASDYYLQILEPSTDTDKEKKQQKK